MTMQKGDERKSVFVHWSAWKNCMLFSIWGTTAKAKMAATHAVSFQFVIILLIRLFSGPNFHVFKRLCVIRRSPSRCRWRRAQCRDRAARRCTRSRCWERRRRAARTRDPRPSGERSEPGHAAAACNKHTGIQINSYTPTHHYSQLDYHSSHIAYYNIHVILWLQPSTF